ncbi:Retrotransposon protein, Ty3-gypsy subclass, partial [Phytophthora megakarya]
DPPVRVEPLRVRLREGVTPVRIGARRYPPTNMEYMDQHVQELLGSGLTYVNSSSRWASPPRIVPKNEPGTYRMTVDMRAVNERTDPIQWPMPILESALGLLEGSSCYFTLDWFRGYWQLPLHPESQEIFSVMTHRGIITPTRVLMGGMDAVAYCQHVVEEVFRPMLYHGVLAWLDDILGYAVDSVDLLVVLERVLAACKSFGLKLHPGKCHFFLREAKWCGKMVGQSGSRKTQRLAKIPLSELGWQEGHVDALRQVRRALVAMVPLAHPDPTRAVCLFCDASQDSWGAICTQVTESDLSKPLHEQDHRPLAFLSGRFTGAQLRWPTIEKEAYAIVESA